MHFYLFDIILTIMCRNDELSFTLSSVGCLLPYSELFILFAENSQKPSQTFFYSHSLNFHVSGGPEFGSKQPTQLISSLQHIIVTYITTVLSILLFLLSIPNNAWVVENVL